LPIRLSTELRQRFSYAIDPKSPKFSPLLSAASILHPKICPLLPPELVIAGTAEIGRWIANLPPSQTQVAVTPIQSNRFRRLASQRSSVIGLNYSWKRYFYNYIISLMTSFLLVLLMTIRRLHWRQTMLGIHTNFGPHMQ
jgi:hypothetical protein